jgi:hypothetical protein
MLPGLTLSWQGSWHESHKTVIGDQHLLLHVLQYFMPLAQ